uniref:Uncharacterized protein n=1 Tax=Rhizophora mucronata TaxID=61149 RepID=A0A2P2NLK4_RHIMU
MANSWSSWEWLFQSLPFLYSLVF